MFTRRVQAITLIIILPNVAQSRRVRDDPNHAFTIVCFVAETQSNFNSNPTQENPDPIQINAGDRGQHGLQYILFYRQEGDGNPNVRYTALAARSSVAHEFLSSA